jgi:hypothetical protein
MSKNKETHESPVENSILDEVLGNTIPQDIVDLIASSKKLMRYLKEEIEDVGCLRGAIANSLSIEWSDKTVEVFNCDGFRLAKFSRKPR